MQVLGVITSILSEVKALLHDYNINALVHQAYSIDKATRTLARAKLKQKEPEIFAMLEDV